MFRTMCATNLPDCIHGCGLWERRGCDVLPKRFGACGAIAGEACESARRHACGCWRWRECCRASKDITPAMILLGRRVYRGRVGGAPCSGCHGGTGQGSPLGPDLTGKQLLWSDGSYEGIKKTIVEGVAQPKKYRSPMPEMGGAQLTPEQVSRGGGLCLELEPR